MDKKWRYIRADILLVRYKKIPNFKEIKVYLLSLLLLLFFVNSEPPYIILIYAMRDLIYKGGLISIAST